MPNETRPYENEHACRLRDPGQFKKGSFRRTSRKHDGKEYGVIMGKLKGETTMTEQAYRYNKGVWSASSARSHCKDHDGSFEAAKDSAAQTEKDNIERREYLEKVEMRQDDGETPKIIGYAAKFNIMTDLGWFKEKIRPGAFDEVLETDDVRCLKNHDVNLLLGRTSSGTLKLNTNTVGLRFENEMPDTTTGKDTLEEVRRGDLTGCSFAFQVAEDHWKQFPDEKDRLPERTIVKVGKLLDVGPVTYPAYLDTTVAARSFDKIEDPALDEGDTSEEKNEAMPIASKSKVKFLYDQAGRIIERNTLPDEQLTEESGQDPGES
ncbi:MAG: HK97 family phage prohead protease [Phycisphaerales bacterium]|jgi:hypothetical protein